MSRPSISCSDLPAGTIGQTFSSRSTWKSTTHGCVSASICFNAPATWSFLSTVMPTAAERAGQNGKVRVYQRAFRIPPAVEQLLPLANHTHVAVVNQHDLNRQLVQHRRRKLGQGHVKAAVAVDVDDQSYPGRPTVRQSPPAVRSPSSPVRRR